MQQVLLRLEQLSPSQNRLQANHRGGLTERPRPEQWQEKGNRGGLYRAQLVPPTNAKVVNSPAVNSAHPGDQQDSCTHQSNPGRN